MNADTKRQLLEILLSDDTPTKKSSKPAKKAAVYPGASDTYSGYDVFTFRLQGFILGAFAMLLAILTFSGN